MNNLVLKQVRTNEPDYAFAENLLLSAFPENEHRDVDAQRNNVDNNSRFNHIVIYENGKTIGFVTYWAFDEFYYIEHFATSPEVRNGGYGKRILEALHEKLNAPVVLEVEMPENEMSRRRITFYERVGYKLLDVPYVQPPYRKEDDFLPMKLMLFDPKQKTPDVATLKNSVYNHVYNYFD